MGDWKKKLHDFVDMFNSTDGRKIKKARTAKDLLLAQVLHNDPHADNPSDGWKYKPPNPI